MLSLNGLAQDSHYSLYHLRNAGLNPALTGYDNSDGEVRTLYRTQWNAISPLTYISLEAEKQDDLWGYGINWNKHGAGAGSLISNQILLGASRQVDINSSGFLRLGFQAGYYQHLLDWQQAIFETQYNPTGPNSPDNGEDLTQTKTSSFDINTGLFLQQKARENTLQIGAAISHLAKDRLSLYETSNVSLKYKGTLHASLAIRSKNNWTIIPNVLFQKQETANESILALRGVKALESNKSIGAGAGIRLKDAFFLTAEFQIENLNISLAYDASISKIRNRSGFGAFEIGLAFRFSPPADYSETVNLRMIDSDNDGIADESDHCPDIPGNSSNHGCPGRADSDGDGIVDEVDLCPGIAGNPIHGGCPDSDGDGVADIDDECPTIYGALHFQGCPDSDQDGISDKYDACPVTPGLIHNKGCPGSKVVSSSTVLGDYTVQTVKESSKPQTNHTHSYLSYEDKKQKKSSQTTPIASLFTPKIYVDENRSPSKASLAVGEGEILDNMMIFFDKDESMLDFLDKKRLRDFISSVPPEQNFKIVLKGHTDEDGSDMYNMELGYRRSASVKRYLSQFGLPEDSVLTLSYGEESPLSITRGEVEDAKNRRVEILLVK